MDIESFDKNQKRFFKRLTFVTSNRINIQSHQRGSRRYPASSSLAEVFYVLGPGSVQGGGGGQK